MIIILLLVILTNGRNLQGGNSLNQKDKWDESTQALDQIFEHVAKNLTQQQKEELELIKEYIFYEGVIYYNQATQEEKQKIFLSFIGMVGELEKESEQERQRLEKDIQYFSQLNITDKNILMTKISQNLDKTLIDSSKEFNSKVVLQIIKNEIENFQNKPDRSGNATWDIQQYKLVQEKNEQELQEIEYQIQEFLDQDLSIEKIREMLTEYIDYFFGNSTVIDQNKNNMDDIIYDVKQQEEKSKTTQDMKQYRQKVRELIRELLKQGKTEEEIQKEVDDYLSKNGVNDLNDDERNLIKLIIKKEIIRDKRQQDYLNDDAIKTTFNSQNNSYYIYLGIFAIILLISLVIFLVRRQKMKQNQRKQIGFRIQDNAQDVEQME